MAPLYPARLSSRTAAIHLVIAAVLLSFVALEVFDIDSSNLPVATRTAATSLEERRAADVERVQPQESLGWPASKSSLCQDVASAGLGGRASSTMLPRPPFLLQGAHKALPERCSATNVVSARPFSPRDPVGLSDVSCGADPPGFFLTEAHRFAAAGRVPPGSTKLVKRQPGPMMEPRHDVAFEFR